MFVEARTDVPKHRSSSAPDVAVRLDFLDGVRGLAAFLVVFTHALVECDWEHIHPRMGWMADFVRVGRAAVAVFIVLSGYCLMLPVTRSGAGILRGGAGAYFKRRALRILPAYYAALAVALLMMYVVPIDAVNAGAWWRSFFPRSPATWHGVILSHVFLVHNVYTPWIYTIDAPMWTVATEWQIYFLFPLILLPVWRRWGIAAMVAAGLVCGFGVLYVFRKHDLALAAPWYAGLFAIGNAAAVVGFSVEARLRHWRDKTPWLLLTMLMLAAYVVIHAYVTSRGRTGDWHYTCVSDMIAGSSAVCFIIWCARRKTLALPSTAVRFLESRPVTGLGHFAYSLYLIHALVLVLMYMAIGRLGLGVGAFAAVFIPSAVVAAIVVAYVFYMAVERPFLILKDRPMPTGAASEAGVAAQR